MSWLDGISFMVSDAQKGAAKNVGTGIGAAIAGAGAAAAGAAAVPAAGQGFTMSTDEMRTLLDKCRNARDDIKSQYNNAESMSRAVPPGNEPASQHAIGDQTRGVNKSGEEYYKALQNQFNYFSSLVDAMEKALGIHKDTEDNTTQAISKAGNNSGGIAG